MSEESGRGRRRIATAVGVVMALLVLAAAGSAGAAGKPRAYAFFNQHCISCKQEAPALRHWMDQVDGRYQVIGVGFREEAAEARAFAGSLGLRTKVVGDPEGALARRLGVGTPTKIAIVDSHQPPRYLDYANWPVAQADSFALTGLLDSGHARHPGPRAKAHRCRGHHAKCHHKKKKKKKVATKVVPHPLYAAAVAWSSWQPPGQFLLLRYLALSATSRSQDVEFARESQVHPVAGVRALGVICGSGATAWRELQTAGIEAPVVVDEAADCPQDLNAGMAGIADPSGGPERLYAPNGRLLSSDLNVNTSVTFEVQPWMQFPPVLQGGYAHEDSGALNVPVPPNVQRSDLDFSQAPGDLAVRGFWWLCPTCVGSESDYELEQWAGSHPAAHLVAATCDPNIHEAADFVVEHEWTFPVYVYEGPLNFPSCFSQVMGGLGIDWYGGDAFLRNGALSKEAEKSFPEYPW